MTVLGCTSQSSVLGLALELLLEVLKKVGVEVL